jgi:ABC-2 type transport system permease protein
VRTHLKHDLDRYLRGRRAEQRGEQTLVCVTRQPHIRHNKGSLVIRAQGLHRRDRLNQVLRGYLQKVKFQEPPYTTVDDFIDMPVPPSRTIGRPHHGLLRDDHALRQSRSVGDLA